MRALAVAILLAVPAAAETLINEATARYEVRLVVDDRLAEAWPTLAAARAAEGAAAIEEFKRDAMAEPRDFGVPYSFVWTEEAPFVSDRLVSVVSTVDFYTGGAHGNRGVRAATWDRSAEAPIPLSRLLTEAGVAAAAASLTARIAAEVHGVSVPEFWREAVAQAAAPERLDAFALAPGAEGNATGLSYRFAPYEVAPYSSGAPMIKIPAATFADGLTVEGAEIFGR